MKAPIKIPNNATKTADETIDFLFKFSFVSNKNLNTASPHDNVKIGISKVIYVLYKSYFP